MMVKTASGKTCGCCQNLSLCLSLPLPLSPPPQIVTAKYVSGHVAKCPLGVEGKGQPQVTITGLTSSNHDKEFSPLDSCTHPPVCLIHHFTDFSHRLRCNGRLFLFCLFCYSLPAARALHLSRFNCSRTRLVSAT